MMMTKSGDSVSLMGFVGTSLVIGGSRMARRVSPRLRVMATSATPGEAKVEESQGKAEGPIWVEPRLPEGFTPPQPKRFSVRKENWVDIVSGSAAAAFRGYTGALVSGYAMEFLRAGLKRVD